MEAKSWKIAEVFNNGGNVHYILPHFQREYAWEKENWQTLLDDVKELYDSYDPEKSSEHFMGALVVIEDGNRGFVPVNKLVDGQQRLTTISLMLCALGKIVQKSNLPLYRDIRSLLVNSNQKDLLYFKLLPTSKYGDRDAYLSLLMEKPCPSNIDSRIPETFRYILREFEIFIKNSGNDPERLFLTLVNSLQVVFIKLDPKERPYKIFESLNNKGKQLSQADLVRNYIAMKLPEKNQSEVFDNYWSKIETLLQEKRTVGRSRFGELTAFLRHYLALRNGVLCNEEHVYERFRDRVENEFANPADFEQEIATLKTFAEYYNRLLRPDFEIDARIRTRLQRLNTLEISTAYPFLLAVYEVYDQEHLKKDDFIDVLSILENFTVRRYLTREPTNYLNKMFPTLWREMNPTKFIETLRKVIVTKNYPTDHRIRRELLTGQLYDKRSQTRDKVSLILESINRFLSDQAHSGGYTVLDANSTIEHIMPQHLSDEWKKHLGPTWEQIYTDYIHTLGNLTLVTQEWNSELSNASFEHKKKRLSNHALRLNSDYFNRKIEKWDDGAIRARTELLTDAILSLWPELGTPPMPQKSTGTKPQTLKILGQSFAVSTWRDVAFFTAQTISELVDNFDSRIAEQMPSYFDRQEFRIASRQLPNGWWINMNLSASSIKGLCRNIVSLAGLPEDEFQVEET